MAIAATTAKVDVVVHPSGTSATLRLPGARGARTPVTHDQALRELAGAGVALTQAVRQRVQALIEDAAKSTKPVASVVAEASLPTDGSPATIRWLDEQRDEGVDESADQAADHYARGAYLNVAVGDVLGQWVDAVAAVDGTDVFGRSLPADRRRVRDRWRLGDGVARADDGSIVAAADGVLVRRQGEAAVRRVLEIADSVDFSTGNISHTGDLLVQGGVRDRFKVRVDGDVEVRGLIQAATVACSGSLRAFGGVAGRERGTVITGGDLAARYLDNVVASVGDQLRVQREMINCQLTVFGELRSPTGSLIGGSHVVRGIVELSNLGSAASAVTDLTLGTVPQLDHFLDKLQLILDKLDRRQARLRDELAQHRRLTPKPNAADRERQTELEFTAQAAATAHAKGRMAMEQLRQAIGKLKTVDLRVHRSMHPNVRLTVGGATYRLVEMVRGPFRLNVDGDGRPMVTGQGRAPVGLRRLSRPETPPPLPERARVA